MIAEQTYLDLRRVGIIECGAQSPRGDRYPWLFVLLCVHAEGVVKPDGNMTFRMQGPGRPGKRQHKQAEQCCPQDP